jgi:hypothetical protein
MKMKWLPFLVAGIFVVNSIFLAWLAWGGSQFAVATLTGSIFVLSVIYVLYAVGWRNALEGWGRSTAGWAAAQTWGMKQDTILRDVLKELYEFDEEAVEIHSGRSTNASVEYLKTFAEEEE